MQIFSDYIELELEVSKNTEWQEQISQKRARCISITTVILLSGEFSIN